jgi:hypothetical protein
MTSRRFPAPWRADKISGGYVVRDANGQALAHIYSRDNEAEALRPLSRLSKPMKNFAMNIFIGSSHVGRTYGDTEKLACVEREIAMRRSVYPRLVYKCQLKQEVADREIALMEAIARDYRARIDGPDLFPDH